MYIAELSIRRPVLAIVMNLLVLLAGFMAFQTLTVREYPNIDPPVVTVDTAYKGASAAVVESTVTKLLEDSLSGIEGIDYLTSVSRSENSQISIRFLPARDIDAAANDVRDRVARVRGRLPAAIDEPVVAKTEADAQPILWLAFSSDRHEPVQVSELADRQVRDRLQTLPGVADIRVFGERRPSMRIWLDGERLAAYNLTPRDVENALRAQNVEIPSGRIESRMREFAVLAETDLNTPEEFGRIIVREDQGSLIRLGDLARIEVGPQDERRIVRFNGQAAVALGVIKQSTANPLDVSKAVKAVLPQIEATLPAGMKMVVAYDSSVFIEGAITSVRNTILEAVALVVLVIFVFLRTVRATLIPLMTIPVSLIGAMIFMQLFGFSLNTLTLLAMVLAIGLVVDDAIVVLENIYRHIEEGLAPLPAAIQGVKEIGFAVLAMTFTLAAVFAPIAFTSGRTGKLFAEFALTLAGAVIVSGFVALTLSPMMASRLLRPHRHMIPLSAAIERALKGVERGYIAALQAVLRARWWLLAGAAASFALTAALFVKLPSELAPVEDRGVILGLSLAPDGSTPQYLDTYARQVEKIFDDIPEQSTTFMVIGFPDETKSISFNRMRLWDERERSTMAIADSIRPQLWQVPGVMALSLTPPSLGQRASSSPVEFVIQTTGSYADLGQTVGALMGKLAQNPGLNNVIPDLKLNKPQLSVTVNRDKAALLGVGVEDIGRALETLLGGRKVTTFKRSGTQYDVLVQMSSDQRRLPEQVAHIYLRSGNGVMVPLSNLVDLKETVSPAELNHFNKLRSAKISANLAPGYTLGEAMTAIDQAASELRGPQVMFDWDGQSREFLQASGTLLLALLLALLFIYLVLAAQFESFRDPFIIMFSVPTAMLGAALAMRFTGGSLNVYSQIGLITLVGLITKHGILLVEFANQLQAQGRRKWDAVVESARLRLRPILMTTAAMVLGAIPLALAHGPGAESRQAIGWVVVGGMSLGTVFTLFLVPVVYLLIGARIAPESATTEGVKP